VADIGKEVDDLDEHLEVGICGMRALRIPRYGLLEKENIEQIAQVRP
jgi:hypothetical protein